MIKALDGIDNAGLTLAAAAALLDGPQQIPIERFVELGGTSVHLAIAAHQRWGCALDLVAMDADGTFSDRPLAWVAPYLEVLKQAGVAPEHVRVIVQEKDLSSSQLIANLSGFGDAHKIRHIEPVLAACLSNGGQMFVDIRKGSGAYPFLKPYGAMERLSVGTNGVHRVRLTRQRTVPDQADVNAKGAGTLAADALADDTNTSPAATEDWAGIATKLAGSDGFYRESDEHAMLFIKRSDTLVVTFDNLDIAMEKRDDKRPWGFAFIEKQGWSMLGVTAAGWTWFRDPWVYKQFDDLKKKGFFKRFKRVVFYGASMGGYGACAFAAACPGADVLAISPQSTLDKKLVPFETRYKTAWDRNYSGKYGDAAKVSAKAGRVTLIYDPYEPLDSGHVDRFTAKNVVKLRAPLMGHRLGSSLQQMGILSSITLGALNGTLTEAEFYQKLRARKTFARYQKELFKRALDKGHPDLARKMGRWVLTHGGNRHIRKAMEDM